MKNTMIKIISKNWNTHNTNRPKVNKINSKTVYCKRKKVLFSLIRTKQVNIIKITY
jgi:hypothetical protein